MVGSTEFYKDLDLRYPELAICMEDCIDRGKFFIPILFPLLEKDKIDETTDLTISTKNIKSNIGNLDIQRCTTVNYIELKLPYGISTAKKGDQFIIVFIGGDINKGCLIGRYEE